MLIIADDLSGAAECAVACTNTGMRAAVALSEEGAQFNVEILSVDSDTRYLQSHLAADRVAGLMRRYSENPNTLVYKKVDSTLRGNVGAELAAILKVRRDLGSTNRRAIALLAPAFPAGGRTTVSGSQFVHGKPLHESETWRHQLSSCFADIPSMLRAAGLRPALAKLDQVRSGVDALQHAINDLSSDADVLVCDAETDGDLRTIATASCVLGSETIWAGSAGLAYHLPRAAGLSSVTASSITERFATGPVLIVIGSMSSLSRQQVAALAEVQDVEVVSIPVHVLLAGSLSEPWAEFSVKISKTLHQGCDIAVVLESVGQLDHSKGRLLSSALAAMVSPFRDTVGSLIASGGETARAILERWGIASLRLIGELEPGLPIAAVEEQERYLPVMTKAGAFGNLQTLVQCLRYLHTLERSSAGQNASIRGSR
jgi:4-hydroxythreonine-4-phosphate dehydrogenase